MRAAAIVSLPTESFEQVELPEPVPAEDEIVLEVEACGICGTDLHILAGVTVRARARACRARRRCG